MRPELKYVQTPQKTNCANIALSKQGDFGTVNISFLNQPLEDNMDTFKSKKQLSLSNIEKQKYEAIYQRISAICEKHDIDINMAKNYGLLERIAGVMTKAELVQLKEEEIANLVSILDDNLGWGDGLGFGKKDINDLTKLVKDINIKKGYEKTGGSKFWQIVHNVKNEVKCFFGGETALNYKDSNDITNYYKEKYLADIMNLSEEEKIKVYKELLEEFFYDFNMLKQPDKQVNMLKAIENLAANDRLTMVKVIEKCFMHDNQALTLFGKVLAQDYESIVLNRDGFNNTVGKLEAANISHIAFKHMTEDDINNALSNHKEKAKAFLDENSELIQKLRKQKSEGIALSLEEENILLMASCYEAKYAGALTGTFANHNLNENSRFTLCSTISNDTEELGIQEEVFLTANSLVEETPDIIPFSREKFTQIMDKASNNKYSEIIMKHTTTAQEDSKTTEKNNDNKKEGNSESSFDNSDKEFAVKEQNFSRGLEANLNLPVDYSVCASNQKDNETNSSRPKANFFTDSSIKSNLKQVSSPLEQKNIYIDSLTPKDKNLAVDIKDSDIKKIAKQGIKAIEAYIIETKSDKNEIALSLLNLGGLDSEMKTWALVQFDTLNENQKAKTCSRITNNENKMEAGKYIRTISALKNVECNNAAVKDFFEMLIEERKKEQVSLNIV